jgi:hypothetical protein
MLGLLVSALSTFPMHPNAKVKVSSDIDSNQVCSPLAFAERLGIETDWNSCILLSSEQNNGSKVGYLEPHDIKAKLPRGIENIRPHLQSVDDIPLHVSLFADCTTETKLEMMRVFQEYGEVVCCLGSSLYHANTTAFAMVNLCFLSEIS